MFRLIIPPLFLLACSDQKEIKGLCIVNETGVSLNHNIDVNEAPDSVPTVRSAAAYNVIMEGGLTYAQGLCYAGGDNSEQSAPTDLIVDAFVPDNNEESRPAVVLIHGGGFNGGDRFHEHIVDMAHHFTERGFVAFSIDYRKKDDFGSVPDEWVDKAEEMAAAGELASKNDLLKIYPAIRDAKAALRWVAANAGYFKINPDYISVGGGSAGATSAIGVAITAAEDYRDEIDLENDSTLATTNLEQAFAIQSVLDFWGGLAALNLIEGMYGHQRFDSNAPPILIVHGTEDPTVPFSEAEELKANYDELSIPYAYHPLEGKGHGPWQETVNGQSLSALAFDFMVAQQGLGLE